MIDTVYTKREAARELKISEPTLDRRVRSGEIDSLKNGKYRMFTKRHLFDYIKRIETLNSY